MFTVSKPAQDEQMGTVAYESAEYRQNKQQWRFLRMMFDGSDSWLNRDEDGIIHPTTLTERFLPREPAEQPPDYLNRLYRSPFDDRFAQSIRKFVTLILNNGLEIDVPAEIERHLENIDNQGSTLRSFLKQVMVAVLRDGHSFVLVDYPPPDFTIRSEADRLRAGRRPAWVHYQVDQMIFCRTIVKNGQTHLAYAVLRELATIAGDSIERQAVRYRVLKAGGVDKDGVNFAARWELWEEQPDPSDKTKVLITQIDEGFFTMREIPLTCWYGGLRTGFYRSRPPLKALADLNLTHYQVKSDHLRKIHLCCLPVPELRDSMRPPGEPLDIGPNSYVHIVDPNGSFNWKEPLATSIEQTRREVQDLESAMDILSAAYLTNPGDRQAAATTFMQASEIEASLGDFAASIAEGIFDCLAFHAAYMGLSAGGSVTLSGEVIREKGVDSQMLLALTNLGTQLSLILQSGPGGEKIARLLLRILQTNFFIPEDWTIEEML
jgi:CRISPR/Cas system CMR-associated protein Cmr5 small subunit